MKSNNNPPAPFLSLLQHLWSACLMLFGIASLTGCINLETNHSTAIFWKTGDRYIIEVTGKRLLMAHDLVSIMKMRTYVEKWQFDVPRIEGEIDGSEIHHKPGHYSYVGKIIIRGDVMRIKLSYDNYDDKRLDAVSWNGKYTLVEKKEPSEQSEETGRS